MLMSRPEAKAVKDRMLFPPGARRPGFGGYGR